MGRDTAGVEKRPKSIRISFRLDGELIRERVTVDGRALEPTPANVKYATRLAADIRRRIAAGTFDMKEFFPDSKRSVSASQVKRFGDLCDEWLKTLANKADWTRAQYTSAINCWKRLLGADTDVRDLTRKEIEKRIAMHPWPSAKTHNDYLIALRGVMRFEFGSSDRNPVAEIKNMRVVRRLPDPLSPIERDSILADMETRYDPRVAAYFKFAFFSGMRPEEIIALRWSDVDFNAKTVRVQRVRTKGKERNSTKTGVDRDVDLVPAALAALTAMKPYTSMKDASGAGQAVIFESPIGQPWRDERLQRETYWQPCLKRLGIRGRRPYVTRHSFATAALMAGVPPAYVARQLGHSVQMLLDSYVRWIPGGDGGAAREMLQRAMERAA